MFKEMFKFLRLNLCNVHSLTSNSKIFLDVMGSLLSIQPPKRLQPEYPRFWHDGHLFNGQCSYAFVSRYKVLRRNVIIAIVSNIFISFKNKQKGTKTHNIIRV